MHTSQLEGWNLVSTTQQKVFEIWSSGDKMPDGQGGPSVVYAGAGNGRNWLSLNAANGNGHETLGIERSVNSQLGATYTLSFDYAGQVGASLASTQIGIYVDGVKLAAFADTSPASALDWQTLSFQFTGNGRARTIRIVTEPTSTFANGRGAMIDDIVLTEQWELNTGYVNTPIKLAPVSASLSDVDGSETLALLVHAIPVGAVLTDGTNSFTAATGSTSVNVSGWNWNTLSIKAPAGTTGSFTLKVTAVATESATGQTLSTTRDLVVSVKPATAGTPSSTSASIVIQSSTRDPIMVLGAQGTLYVANGIVSTTKPVEQTPVIDWSGTLSLPSAFNGAGASNTGNNWVGDFLGAGSDSLDLAAQTGLKVQLTQ